MGVIFFSKNQKSKVRQSMADKTVPGYHQVQGACFPSPPFTK